MRLTIWTCLEHHYVSNEKRFFQDFQNCHLYWYFLTHYFPHNMFCLLLALEGFSCKYEMDIVCFAFNPIILAFAMSPYTWRRKYSVEYRLENMSPWHFLRLWERTLPNLMKVFIKNIHFYRFYIFYICVTSTLESLIIYVTQKMLNLNFNFKYVSWVLVVNNGSWTNEHYNYPSAKDCVVYFSTDNVT